jgi:type VI secretion system secreted protein VgrG
MPQEQYLLHLTSQSFDVGDMRVLKLVARERMSQPYRVELEVICPDHAPLDVDKVAGAEATASIRSEAGGERRFHGIIIRVEEGAESTSAWIRYRLVLAPRLWHTSLVETLDIYLDLTVPEIVDRKLSLAHLTLGNDYETRLEHSYPRRPFVVQYKESDMAFVSRLCEHLGIFYFFEQEERFERLVFGDSVAAYRRSSDDAGVPWAGHGAPRGVFELCVERDLVPRVYVCRDYNEDTPTLELQADHRLDEGYGGGVIEYGGDFRTPEEGKRLARVRAEERLCRQKRWVGKSVEMGFSPGHVFGLEGHARLGRNLVLTEVVHEAHGAFGFDGADPVRDPRPIVYENRFVAIPDDRCFRPERSTPVPRVHGLLTGIVETAQGGIESHAKIDDQGRYTVRFLFDTSAPGERKASCPVRMIQPSVGPGYGMHFPLKPGVEVLIGFVDGNPDRPVVVGAVPNPVTPTPVAAGIASKSRIVSRSGIVIEFEDASRRA